MMPVVAAYSARWVLPVSSPPIEDGVVLVDGAGRIQAVGPSGSVPYDSAELVDLGASVILPGLVNLHAHPELTVLRGQLEAGSFVDWLARLTELKYDVLTPEALRTSTWLGVAENIAAGVTCLVAPDDAGFLMAAMAESGLRGRVYREVFGPAPSQATEALEGLRANVDAMRSLQDDRLEAGVSPHAPFTVSTELYRQVADYAANESLPVCIHAAESEAEELFTRDGSGPFAERLRARGIEVESRGASPIAWLASTGILETRPLLVHCVRVNDEDVKRIADAGASIAHCPISNAKFGHGIAPLADFRAAGIPVGFGSDSVASNNRVDILEEARFAALALRGVTRTPDPLPPDQLLQLATLQAARALGLEERIGSLEPGKDADFIAVRLDRPHTLPTSDPVAGLFHSARGSDVILSAVKGRILYRDGSFATLDWSALASAAGRGP